MIRRKLPAAALALALVATGLGGCVSLFPKAKPSQLYRFAAETTVPAPAEREGDSRVGLILPPVTLTRASAGDQMLAVTGDETAYIAGARWISPAAVLWEESVRGAFSGRSARTRLLSRTEVGTGQAFLRLTVPVFETRYPAPEAAPTVHVRLSAMLLHRAGPFAAAQTFEAAVPAADNRVSAIVAAYDQAVEKVTTELVGWADAHAEAAAVDVPAAPPPPAVAANATRRDGLNATSTTETSTSTTQRRVRRDP